MHQARVILYHNTPASARLRFLRFPYQSICAFKPLPKLSVLMDQGLATDTLLHPAVVARQTENKLGLGQDSIQVQGEFEAFVDVAGGPICIHLAAFTSLDPPFELADKLDARFIDLNQARDLPQVELELLRKAYDIILGNE